MDKGIRTLSNSVKELESKLQSIDSESLVKKSKIENILVGMNRDNKTKQLDEIHASIIQKVENESGRDFNVFIDKLVFYVEEYSPRIAELVGFALIGELKYTLVFKIAVEMFRDVSTEILGSCIESSHKKQFTKTKHEDGTTSYDISTAMKMVNEYDPEKNKTDKKVNKKKKKLFR